MPEVITPADEATRKRFARRQWARRWVAWRPILAVVLVLGSVTGLVWLVYFSPVLAVERVEVEGERYLSARQVETAARIPLGEPLARVDVDAIRTRVESLAPVRAVDVTRAWPDGILISVDERVPVAVVRIGTSLKGIDADGVVFRPFATRPGTLPLITTSPGAIGTEAMAEVAGVVAVLPVRIQRIVEHVEVESVDRISLVLRDGRIVLWGSAEAAAEKAAVLDVLLKTRAERYDVSVPGQPTTSN